MTWHQPLQNKSGFGAGKVCLSHYFCLYIHFWWEYIEAAGYPTAGGAAYKQRTERAAVSEIVEKWHIWRLSVMREMYQSKI
jgi:hypothetical protein